MWQTQKQTDTGHGTYQTWNWVTFCDPATQRPGNPATRWPCSIMNSKCRLMCRGVRIIDVAKKYSQAKEFLIITGKSKSSLHGLTSSDFSPTTDTWLWLLLFQHLYVLHFGHFFENRKNSGLTPGQNDDPVTRWPGRKRWPKRPIDPVTQWPSSMSDGHQSFTLKLGLTATRRPAHHVVNRPRSVHESSFCTSKQDYETSHSRAFSGADR